MPSAPKLLGIPRSITDPVIAFALVAIVWEKAVDLFQIKRYLLPPLSQILQTSWNNRDLLLRESMVTAWEVLLGYVWALAGGILLGLAIFAWPVFRRTVYPLVVMFQGLPRKSPSRHCWWCGLDTARRPRC